MKTSKKAAKLGKPRRKAVPLWKRPSVVWVAGAVLVVGLGSGVWWTWSNNVVGQLVEQTKWRTIAFSAKIGFRVNEVLVVGRKETTSRKLREAIRLDRGAPILAYDLEAARGRVEALPWVRRATIERMLPDTILLTIEERKPLAVWQHQGKFALIDHEGEIILREGLGRFGDLLVIVGENAPHQAAKLLDTLNTEPQLQKMVKAAVWVSDRRWNLRLDGDIDVRLPEDNLGAAWTRLAEYERAHSVLERDVQILDLRIPDRLIVRKASGRRSDVGSPGRET